MFVKVAALRKLPVAVRVRALEGPITRVRALMDGEAADHAKGLVASWKVTFVGALIGMRTHVLRQGTCLAETLVTHGTYIRACLLYTSPSPRDQRGSRMPSSA